MRYIDENLIKTEKRDFIDYLKWCQELDYDLSNEFILFPKPFKLAHDRTLEVIEDKKDEIRAAELKKESEIIKKMAAEVKKQFAMETELFIIVVPKSARDLIKEGHTLHHCVGTYVKNVAQGKTNILFIRKKDSIKKAFYTMEVRNGKLVQVRGANNCDMTDEVKLFVNSFKTKMLPVEKVA